MIKRILVPFLIVASIGGADAFRTYGDRAKIAIPVTGLGIAMVKNDKEGIWQLTKVIISSQAVTEILKDVVNTRRPDGGKKGFPSGHTSSAFAGAGFIQKRYGSNLGVPAYIAATFVGVSRVTSRRHYIHDVIGGAVIGIGATEIFTKKFEEKLKKRDVKIFPAINRIILVYRW